MEDIPILEITKRQKSIPWLEFGQVHVGSQVQKCLKIVNRRSGDVRLSMKLVGFQEGLSIQFEDSSPEILLHSGCETRVVAVWGPSEEAKFKKSVQILVGNDGTTFRAHVVGVASDRNPKKAVRGVSKKTVNALRPKKDSEMNKKPLHVRSRIKAKKRPAPKKKRDSSLAPSRKRSNHDEHLDTQQQEVAFQVLLNNVLCNIEEEETPFSQHEETTTAHPILEIQKKKEQLLRRRRACQLFCTPEFSFTMEQISEEILSGKLSVREDKVLSADVGLQNILLELLFQYDLKWLHLGLEIVFGERIQMNCDMDKKNKKKSNSNKKNKLTPAQREMRTFLRNRFIKDPELHDRFKSTIEGLYGNNGAYAKALHRHTLRLFLSLVLFLDKAAQLEPPLMPTRKGIFRADADYKRSEDIVTNFAREVLHGEGNIIRHLGNLGYELSFEQSWYVLVFLFFFFSSKC